MQEIIADPPRMRSKEDGYTHPRWDQYDFEEPQESPDRPQYCSQAYGDQTTPRKHQKHDSLYPMPTERSPLTHEIIPPSLAAQVVRPQMENPLRTARPVAAQSRADGSKSRGKNVKQNQPPKQLPTAKPWRRRSRLWGAPGAKLISTASTTTPRPTGRGRRA